MEVILREDIGTLGARGAVVVRHPVVHPVVVGPRRAVVVRRRVY